jgi:hypothetical protein
MWKKWKVGFTHPFKAQKNQNFVNFTSRLSPEAMGKTHFIKNQEENKIVLIELFVASSLDRR